MGYFQDAEDLLLRRCTLLTAVQKDACRSGEKSALTAMRYRTKHAVY